MILLRNSESPSDRKCLSESTRRGCVYFRATFLFRKSVLLLCFDFWKVQSGIFRFRNKDIRARIKIAYARSWAVHGEKKLLICPGKPYFLKLIGQGRNFPEWRHATLKGHHPPPAYACTVGYLFPSLYPCIPLRYSVAVYHYIVFHVLAHRLLILSLP